MSTSKEHRPRCFPNRYAGREAEIPVLDKQELRKRRDAMIDQIRADRAVLRYPSVYEGAAGVALMMYHAFLQTGERSRLLDAISYIDAAAELVHRDDPPLSFVTGTAGVYSLRAAISRSAGMPDMARQSRERLLQLAPLALRDPSDELLYGRCGYLYSLMFSDWALGPTEESMAVRQAVIQQVFAVGKTRAQRDGEGWPLMYRWHHATYLGAAHGFAGILHTMLTAGASGDLLESFSRRLPSLQIRDGVYPLTLEKPKEDRVVQWCHGSPGMIAAYCQAHQKYELTVPGSIFLKGATTAATDVWNRGLLSKSVGLCHGISGNAYGLLSMYRHTKDAAWMNRASAFLYQALNPPPEITFEQGGPASTGFETKPEERCTLFNGKGGLVCLCSEFLGDPANSFFPGYELPQVRI